MRLRCHFQRICRGFFHRRELLFIDGVATEGVYKCYGSTSASALPAGYTPITFARNRCRRTNFEILLTWYSRFVFARRQLPLLTSTNVVHNAPFYTCLMARSGLAVTLRFRFLSGYSVSIEITACLSMPTREGSVRMRVLSASCFQ